MLYGLLLFLFILVCLTLIGSVLIQKGKSSLGMFQMGGGTQMLFGGSGGQEFFQKISWALGALFMGGSLLLATMKLNQARNSGILGALREQARAAAKTIEVPEVQSEVQPTKIN